jgi:hypothetical protein
MDSALIRLPRGMRYISRDGCWIVGDPPTGTGWWLRPVGYEDLEWWNQQDFPNYYRTLARVATFLDTTFHEGPTRPLSSLVIASPGPRGRLSPGHETAR